MRKLSLISASLMLALGLSISAQDCTLYFPSEIGTELTYTNYLKPGKPESSVKYVVTEKEVKAGETCIGISAENFDAKGKPELSYQFNALCKDGVFYVDMRNMLGSMDIENFQDFTIESKDMQFPSNPAPGQQLPDASITLSMTGPISMNMSVNITNRKIEAIEEKTTAAGSFKCFKLTSTSSSAMAFVKTESKVTEWYAPNIGSVRSETINSKNGKLISISELTSIKAAK